MRALRERPRVIAASALVALVLLAAAAVAGALIAGADDDSKASQRVERAERVAGEQARQVRRLERELRARGRRAGALERRGAKRCPAPPRRLGPVAPDAAGAGAGSSRPMSVRRRGTMGL